MRIINETQKMWQEEVMVYFQAPALGCKTKGSNEEPLLGNPFS
jgi:hypothetical protein